MIARDRFVIKAVVETKIQDSGTKVQTTMRGKRRARKKWKEERNGRWRVLTGREIKKKVEQV